MYIYRYINITLFAASKIRRLTNVLQALCIEHMLFTFIQTFVTGQPQ